MLLVLIRFYQVVFAPIMPVGCKFYPSCSHYAVEAIQKHGVRRGAWFAAKRLLRCRPGTQGGVDLVPDPEEETRTADSSQQSFHNEIGHNEMGHSEAGHNEKWHEARP